MALITFKQYSSFLFFLAIFVAFTAANSSTPNKKETIDQYRPNLPNRSNNIIHKVKDIIDESGPSPGEGNGSPPRTSNVIHNEGYTVAEKSGPSHGEGHGSPPGTNNAIHKEGYSVNDESVPNRGEGQESPPKTRNAIHNEAYIFVDSGPSPGEGHYPSKTSNAIHQTLLLRRKFGIRKEIKY